MKFKIDRQVLYNYLQYSQEISEQHGVNTYYAYFYFEVLSDKLIIKSADRQTTLQIEINTEESESLEIIETGKTLLPGSKIHNIISTMPEGIVLFSKEEKDVIIKPEKTQMEIQFSVRSREAEDYPKTIHQEIPQKNYSINRQEFLRIIRNTSFAASLEVRETTLFLTGIFFEIKDGFLVAVATDRNRISISKMKLDEPMELSVADGNDLIIPSKSINFIKKLLFKENAQLFVGITGERVFFKLDNFLISANVITGKYYDYTRIIPQDKRNIIKTNRIEIQRALERVSSVADDKRDVVVKLTVENQTLTLRTEEQEKGAGKEIIQIKQEGKDEAFQIKAQFLTDPLKVIDTEEIVIEYGDESRDLIKITSVPEDETMHIAAPINL